VQPHIPSNVDRVLQAAPSLNFLFALPLLEPRSPPGDLFPGTPICCEMESHPVNRRLSVPYGRRDLRWAGDIQIAPVFPCLSGDVCVETSGNTRSRKVFMKVCSKDIKIEGRLIESPG